MADATLALTEQSVEALAKKFRLRRTVAQRAHLTTEAIEAMVESALRLSVDGRTKLSVAGYISTASSTGMRSCSMLRRGAIGKLKRRQGARWKNITFFAIRDPEGGETNLIVAWYRPPFTKHSLEAGMSYPLHQAAKLCLSASNILLLAAEMDGGLDEQIGHYLSPRYLGHLASRPIPIKDTVCVLALSTFPNVDRREQFVFRNARPASMTTPILNKHLKIISEALGFETVVTSHAFRHYVARSLYLASKHNYRV